MEFFVSEETQLLLESIFFYGAILSILVVFLTIPCLLIKINSHLRFTKYFWARMYLTAKEEEDSRKWEAMAKEEDVERQTREGQETEEDVERQTREGQETEEEGPAQQSQTEDAAFKTRTSNTQNSTLKIIVEEP